jgi:predicted NAD/FAD-dependent oxidoreductase
MSHETAAGRRSHGPEGERSPAADDRPSGRSDGTRPGRVAVIGAGLSGLACARTLCDHGRLVTVFEKARGPGGRTSTRRHGDLRFDHGAQYFTARDPRFARRVEAWRKDGIVAPWAGRIVVVRDGVVRPKDDGVERLVGVPGMNALCRRLAGDLPVSFGVRVARLEADGDRWRLVAEDGSDLGVFDAVAVSAPAPQTADLLRPVAPELAARSGGVSLAPCWSVMLGFERRLETGFDGAFVHGSPLSWVARNASKPGRPGGEAWVLHATPEWSAENLELPRSEAARRLLEAFRNSLGRSPESPAHLDAHRWRYALPPDPLPSPFLLDGERRLVACGDWCGGPRVEGAFLSGVAAADALLALPSLAARRTPARPQERGRDGGA